MTDNPESAGTVEPQATPTPAASQSPASQPSGSPSVDALVKAILSHPDFQRETQSVKDKRIAEMQKDLGTQNEQIARLAKVYGTTPENIIRGQQQLEYDANMAWVAEQRGGRVQGQRAPGSAPDFAKAKSSILAATGLTDAPGFDDYLATLDWSDPVSSTLKATAWAQERKAPTPTAADQAPARASAPATGDNQQNYINEMLAARGRPSEIRAIKEKYKKLGVDVNNIGFS